MTSPRSRSALARLHCSALTSRASSSFASWIGELGAIFSVGADRESVCAGVEVWRWYGECVIWRCGENLQVKVKAVQFGVVEKFSR